MDSVQAVLLDAGGVFLLPDPALIGAVTGPIGEDAIVRAYYGAINDADDGDRFGWTDFYRRLAARAGMPEDRLDEATAALARTFTARNIWDHPLPGARTALAELADTGTALAIVSNSDGTVEATLRDRRLCQVGAGAGVPVELVVDSHAVGVAKPDPEIFRLALTSLGVEPGRAIHVGDTRFADVAGARAAGIRPVHVDPYGDCPQPDDHEHVPNVGAVAMLLAG